MFRLSLGLRETAGGSMGRGGGEGERIRFGMMRYFDRYYHVCKVSLGFPMVSVQLEFLLHNFSSVGQRTLCFRKIRNYGSFIDIVIKAKVRLV